jgi:hypothetical protein
MIFELVQDFEDALDAIPQEHPKRRLLAVIAHVLRRNAQLIVGVPESSFSLLHAGLASGVGGEEPGSLDLCEAWSKNRKEPWLRRLHIASLDRLASADLVLRTPYRLERTVLAFAPNDNTLLSVSGSMHGLLWDLKDGRPLGTLHGIPSMVRVWHGSECNATRLPEEFVVMVGHRPILFKSVIRCPSSSELSVSVTDHDRWIEVYSKEGYLVQRWRPHDTYITALIHLGSETRFATASGAGEIAVWDISRVLGGDVGECGHNGRVRGIDVDSHGTRCISVDIWGKSIVWDIRASAISTTLQLGGHYGAGPFVALSSRSEQALVEAPGGELRLVDIGTGAFKVLRVSLPSVHVYRSGAFDRDGFMPLCFARHSGWLLWQNHWFPAVADLTDLSHALDRVAQRVGS